MLSLVGLSQVILNGYGEMTAKNNPLLQSATRNRDYEKEAVQFFENKLTKFGPELQVSFCLSKITLPRLKVSSVTDHKPRRKSDSYPGDTSKISANFSRRRRNISLWRATVFD